MEKTSKAKVFSELYDLMVFYSENRDQPVGKDFDFFRDVKRLCEGLELDYDEFKKEFNLNEGGF